MTTSSSCCITGFPSRDLAVSNLAIAKNLKVCDLEAKSLCVHDGIADNLTVTNLTVTNIFPPPPPIPPLAFMAFAGPGPDNTGAALVFQMGPYPNPPNVNDYPNQIPQPSNLWHVVSDFWTARRPQAFMIPTFFNSTGLTDISYPVNTCIPPPDVPVFGASLGNGIGVAVAGIYKISLSFRISAVPIDIANPESLELEFAFGTLTSCVTPGTGAALGDILGTPLPHPFIGGRPAMSMSTVIGATPILNATRNGSFTDEISMSGALDLTSGTNVCLLMRYNLFGGITPYPGQLEFTDITCTVERVSGP